MSLRKDAREKAHERRREQCAVHPDAGINLRSHKSQDVTAFAWETQMRPCWYISETHVIGMFLFPFRKIATKFCAGTGFRLKARSSKPSADSRAGCSVRCGTSPPC